MCEAKTRSRMHHLFHRSRVTVTSAAVLAFGLLSAEASEPLVGADHWGQYVREMGSCAGTLEHSGSDLTTATDCVVDRLVSGLAAATLNEMEEYGKARYGEHFQVNHRISLTASSRRLSADLDVVIPLTGYSTVPESTVSRSLFLQNGVTRWWDERGFRRNDVRFGVVNRFALDEGSESGIVGISMFMQENAERGHTRVVTGLEYMGRWWTGSLNHYEPLTDWRPGRVGYEERAIAGMELGLDIDLTKTLGIETAAGRWENRDGSDTWGTRGRLGIEWRPHSWFQLNGNWNGIGADDDSKLLQATFTMPLGGSERPRERWLGLGVAGLEEPDPEAIWRPVDHVGRIEVAEREVQSADAEANSGVWELTIPDISGQQLLGLE